MGARDIIATERSGAGLIDKLKIIHCGSYYTIINCNGQYFNHAHTKKYSTAELLCRLIKHKKVPRSAYLRESCKRVTLDNKYINEIEIKQERDRNKLRYINVNKGARK